MVGCFWVVGGDCEVSKEWEVWRDRRKEGTDGQVYALARSPLFLRWLGLCTRNGRRTLDRLSSLLGGCCVLSSISFSSVKYGTRI